MQTRRISRYISILAISLLLCPIHSAAQSKRKAGTTVKDTTALFKGFAVSADLAGAAMTLMSDYGQYEAALRINLKDHYFPIVEVGLGQADHTDDGTNIHYKTSAPYARVGIDFNLLSNKHDIYRLYGGFRLAYTNFKYDVNAPAVTDPVWGGESSYGGNGISANYMWLEGAFGVDAKIWGPFHLGWSVRYRAKLSANTGELGNVWYVPGFGRSGGTRMGATFNLSIDI